VQPQSPAKRIVLRFLLIYFGIFFLADIALPGEDTRVRWMLAAGSAGIAAVAAILWSVFDWGKIGDERLRSWLRLLLRVSLALPMIASGIARLIPVQIPYPGPLAYLQRLGELHPMELIWFFVGSSPAFQSFTGLVGLTGGLFLLVPRTILLGAVICAGNLIMVVTLSLCYNMPFKLYLLHLLLVALLLIAPDLRRLANLFLLDRIVEPAEMPPASLRERVFLLLGLGVIAWSLVDAAGKYAQVHPPQPPLYGAWNVEELTVDGKESVDPGRWGWVVFQDRGALDARLATGSRKRYALDLDTAGKTMTLDQRSVLSFQEPGDGVLILEGKLDGHRTRARLRRMKLSNPWFHWILEPELYE
jgi:hypothetical protein